MTPDHAENQVDNDPISDPADALRRRESAEHAGAEFGYRNTACERVVLDKDGPHHLAHYTGSIYDFDMDVLDRVTKPDGTSMAEVRQGCLQNERRLSLQVGNLDRQLEVASTGALIRTVVHTDRGACFCHAVLPQQHIMAVRVDAMPADDPGLPASQLPGVRAADIALSQLVSDIRAELRLDSQNPGGWSTRKPDSHRRRPLARDEAPTTDPYVCGDHGTPTARACRAAIDPADLHYVAHCRDGELVFAADLLGHSRLMPFFSHIGVTARRDFYDDFSVGFGALASRLSRGCAPVINGLLQRVVLDVQLGALYYYRLNIGEYLVGVTLDQSRVSDADDKLAQLTIDCKEAAGIPGH